MRRRYRGVARVVASLERFRRSTILDDESYSNVLYAVLGEWDAITWREADSMLLREFRHLRSAIERVIATDWDTEGESHAG